MQTNGSLADTNLRALLETAQAERATGTLTVRDGNGTSTTLYFLFGHLFHAVGDGILGDEAVIRALGWPAGEFDFDAKAKLPADETVRGSIGELVQQAESRPAEAAPEAATEPEPEPQPKPEPAAEAPTPRRGVKHRPQPKHGREPIPVPAGQVIYDSLKTSFVDFPRLITTLEREAYTGYVRLLTEDAAGLILFREGSALECAYDVGEDPALALGRQALIDFNEEVNNGQGVLDVVSLTPELVDGLYELTVAKPMYSDLYAAWVDPKALLKFLEDRKLSGSMMVRSKGGTGVIIMTAGKLTGAYTSESRDIADSADGVLDLCKDDEAVIEVKAAADKPREPLDVDAVVGSRKVPSGTTQTEMPVYRPEDAAPAQSAPVGPAPVPATAPTNPSMPAWQPAEAPAEPAAAATNPAQPAWQPGAATPTAESLPAQPAAEAAPVAEAVAAPEAAAAANVDWDQVVSELQAMTEDALGNRARKVKDVLAAAERTPAGMEAAIDQVPTISILFVDSSRLESLANDLRAKLHSYLA